jgi:hypothetical protein
VFSLLNGERTLRVNRLFSYILLSFPCLCSGQDLFNESRGLWQTKASDNSAEISICVTDNGRYFSHKTNEKETKFLLSDNDIIQIDDVVIIKVNPFNSLLFKVIFQYSKSNQSNWGTYYRYDGEHMLVPYPLGLAQTKNSCSFEKSEMYELKTREQIKIEN